VLSVDAELLPDDQQLKAATPAHPAGAAGTGSKYGPSPAALAVAKHFGVEECRLTVAYAVTTDAPCTTT
jgi:hypothetical protein